MNLLEILSSKAEREEACSRIYGVVVGVVTALDKLGRAKVEFPWLAENVVSMWARVATPMAGANRGIMFMPEVHDEVLVAFDHGDVRAPYIIGSLWNGIEKPPQEKQDDDNNNIRIIKSRSHHMIILDDTSGSENIQIIDKSGNNKITIHASNNTMTLQVDGDIELKASKGKIVLDAKSVEITSSAETKITAGSSVDVQAKATMTLKGQTVNIN